MKRFPLFHATGIMTLGIAGMALAFTATAASAQADYRTTYDNGSTEQVEVIAPRYYHHRVEGDHAGRAERIYLSHRIQMRASDLRTEEGAHELRARVYDAAYDICRQLEDDVPYSPETRGDCYRDAVAHGMSQARSAIERARYEE